MNPWLLEEGASGSSAGPGAATAAGLVGFSIGSETGGSIVSPSMRCGVTGLRPTYGRVPRTGAMTLCWSLDKLGPMTRGVEDALLVLQAISGPDAGDVASVPSRLDFDAERAGCGFTRRLLSGVDEGKPRHRCRSRGARNHRASWAWSRSKCRCPTGLMIRCSLILFAEAAAAFEELTLARRLERAQGAGARCVAESLPPGALSLRRGFRAGRPLPPQRRAGDGADLFPSGSAAGSVAARRDADHHQLHRPSFADAARGLCRSRRGAQRLGARPRASASEILAAAAGAPRRHADRPPVRRRHSWAARSGAGTGIPRGERSPTGLLTDGQNRVNRSAGMAPLHLARNPLRAAARHTR